MDKKKYIKIALIFICIISVTLIGTYALKLWSSTDNTELTFRIGEYQTDSMICKASEDITVSNIGPVFDYMKDGEVIPFTVLASSSNEEKLFINFNIENITSNLKEESFKYILLSSTDKINYDEVVKGNFLNINNNDTLELISNYVINKTTYYKLIIYIDGNMENPISMQNGSITGNIEVCSKEKFNVTLNVTNGTSNNNTLKVVSGDNAIFTITASDGYTLDIESQTCEGILNSSTGIYTINNITENEECSLTLKEDGPIKKGSLAEHIITTYTSNNAVSTRTDFSDVFTETNDKIYTTDKTEDGSTVYYYAGNTTHNWVLFGGFYWRIIRTNEDGSVRMLYSGTSHDTTTGYIGSSAFNSTSSNQMYVGYMYGTTGSLNNNRINTNSSTVKQYVDNWYANNLLSNYDKYISRTAIYCSDRSIGSGVDNSNEIYFSSNVRLTSNVASYKCGANTGDGLFELYQAITDKFSTSTKNGGNGQLQYSIALITVDELFYAGGLFRKNELSVWYYLNSLSQSITGSIWWWTMSPSIWNGYDSYAWNVIATDGPNVYSTVNRSYGVRPVLSLKSCVKYSSGDGTPANPYTVTIDDDCASKEN